MTHISQSQLPDLIRRAQTGNYEVHGDPKRADCVVAFSFGYREVNGVITPGPVNEALAQFAQQHFQALPKLMQFEIVDAYPSDGTVKRVVYEHRQKGQYLHTRECVEQMWPYMQQQGWHTAIVLAHPYHMPRADAMCQKIGMATIAPVGLGSIPFDPQSQQEWTRSAKDWHDKEARSITYALEQQWI